MDRNHVACSDPDRRCDPADEIFTRCWGNGGAPSRVYETNALGVRNSTSDCASGALRFGPFALAGFFLAGGTFADLRPAIPPLLVRSLGGSAKANGGRYLAVLT